MIYHIARRDDWESAKGAGQYSAPSLACEGFIHCSSRSQVLSVANTLFRGQTDLLLLCVDEQLLTAKVTWEAPAHPASGPAPDAQAGELFPHVYGTLSLVAIVAAFEFKAGEDGFALPSNLPG